MILNRYEMASIYKLYKLRKTITDSYHKKYFIHIQQHLLKWKILCKTTTNRIVSAPYLRDHCTKHYKYSNRINSAVIVPLFIYSVNTDRFFSHWFSQMKKKRWKKCNNRPIFIYSWYSMHNFMKRPFIPLLSIYSPLLCPSFSPSIDD